MQPVRSVSLFGALGTCGMGRCPCTHHSVLLLDSASGADIQGWPPAWHRAAAGGLFKLWGRLQEECHVFWFL